MKTHDSKLFGWRDGGGAAFRMVALRIMEVRLLGWGIAGLLAVWAGYGLGLKQGGGEHGFAPGESVPLDLYAWSESFSEVAEVRTRLRAMCLRAVAEFQVRSLVHRGRIVSEGAGAEISRVGWSEEEDIAAVVEEFRDTSEEPMVMQQYLRVLSELGKDPVWLDRYLDFARRHPRSSLISVLELEARERAERLGRGAEIVALEALLAVVRTLESGAEAAKREGA